MIVFGLDPGKTTGIAKFVNGKLIELYSLNVIKTTEFLYAVDTNVVLVMEDSRIQTYFKRNNVSVRGQTKIARDVGRIDAQCTDIENICKERGIKLFKIPPKGKGSKLNAKLFGLKTGWQGKSNPHCRDAATVAYPFRLIAD